jgi:hypothetical protein
MNLPDYVEPFVDTDAGRWRVTAAVIATIAVALLTESEVISYLRFW